MKKIIFTALLVLFSQSILASKLRNIEWEEVSNKDAITVYKAKKYKHDSGIVPIRFKAILNYDILRVLTVLADDKRKPEWLPNVKKIKVIEKKSIYNYTVYYRYHAPWPFEDRDFIVHNQGSYDPVKKIVSVDIRSSKHEKDPSDGTAVRAKTYDGYSVIHALEDNKTSVEMAFLNDFEGYVPTFIINIVQKQWPSQFMKQLRTQLIKNDIVISSEFQGVSDRNEAVN